MCVISLSYIYTYIDRERDSQPPTLECVIHGRALHTCACVSGGGAARGEATAGGGTAGGGMRTVPAPDPAVRCQGAVAPWAALAASMSRTCVCVCVCARARLCDESLCWHACTHVRMYACTHGHVVFVYRPYIYVHMGNKHTMCGAPTFACASSKHARGL